jgi:sugar phosphate permease
LGHWNWRVLLISEGALPFVWLVIWWWFIDDHPSRARWISAEERNYLLTTLRQECTELEPARPEPYLRALMCPQVLVMVAIYLLLNTGNYGYLFWLPSALGSAKQMSSLHVGILFAIPYIWTVIAMVLNSQHSDTTRERRGHVAAGLAWGGAFLLAGIFASQHSPIVCFAFVCLAGAGPYAALGPFWAIPTETLPRGVAGSAMGLVNAIGNLGGYFGPLVVGYLNQRTGNFFYGFGILSLGLLVASTLTFLLHPAREAPRNEDVTGVKQSDSPRGIC